ncbi:MAG TPA: nucleoside diphosphate kinase regulator [Acidobacteriota bacterium]|nr:nucleoside diphosphate kinase regulator [Acidobacteriota bacterium]HNR39074.1 nucleoside diphosphate kinase regulator [Acidobacteriota bacterium]HNU01415.1 nucleoside diphosphate kinase regulator [Acidobacteriota bacterium]HOB52334.1 nucleoside diphosphate kinase regulator [Acidobacteriota bacterium]HPB27846.1 nucleoside diphosphate kinase regulator [Acidobacteriota bacterium]
MQPRRIFITEYDKERLEKILPATPDSTNRNRQDLRNLAKELARAKIVPPERIPPDVVTMNSRVVLRDLNSDETMTYTLVFPKDADIGAGAISILAPVGTAIIGYAVGDVIEWPVPGGTRRIRIEQILYQPEAAGDFHL